MAHPWVRAGGTIRKEGFLEKNRRMFNKKYWCRLGKGEFRYYTDKSKKALHHAVHIGECKLLVGKIDYAEFVDFVERSGEIPPVSPC